MRLRAAALASASAVIMNLAACASSSPRSTNTAVNNPAVLSESDIDATSQEGTAFDLINHLRPAWFSARGAVTLLARRSPGTLHVSVDGAPLQDLEILGRMRATELKDARFLDATEAAQRFGSMAGSGAVIVVSRR